MRRTIITTMCAAVTFVLAASCNKIEAGPVASDSNGRTVITAVSEAVGSGDTRAHNQYCYDVLWDKGDRIFATGGGNPYFTISSRRGQDTRMIRVCTKFLSRILLNL